MANKFAYGTLVQGEYFTDRINELAKIKQFLNSENHLILISPRRYGKSSLIKKCVEELGRPYIWLDMQYAISTASFTTQLLKATLAQYPMERLKYELRRFRILPTATFNPVTNDYQFSFQTSEAADNTMLKDVMEMLQRLSTPKEKLIVVFDEFQEVRNIDKYLDKQLRSIMQLQKGLNYIFLGSQEGMMLEIFERKTMSFINLLLIVYRKLQIKKPLLVRFFHSLLVIRITPSSWLLRFQTRLRATKFTKKLYNVPYKPLYKPMTLITNVFGKLSIILTKEHYYVCQETRSL